MGMQQTLMKDADVCILNSLTETYTVIPDAMLRDFCSNLGIDSLFESIEMLHHFLQLIT